MKLYIDKHYFISVIKDENNYSCQVMELVHGLGMFNAEITDENQSDIVSCIVHSGFRETNKTCKDLKEIADFHLQCLLDIEFYNDYELNKLESQTYEG